MTDFIISRTPHWNRVIGLRAQLPRFDWLLYMDADALITNSSWTIEHFVGLATSITGAVPMIVLQDSMEVNSGVLLLRGSLHAHQVRLETNRLLDLWWSYGQRIPADRTDQSALMLSLLELAGEWTRQPARAVVTAEECSVKRLYWQIVACWEVSMARLGLPFGGRSFGRVVFLPNTVNVLHVPAEVFNVASVGDATASAAFMYTWSLLKDRLRSMPVYARDGRAAPAHAWSSSSPPSSLRSDLNGATTEASALVMGRLSYSSHSQWESQDSAHRRPIRGFNSINAVGNVDLAWGLHPAQLWLPGDFVVHVTNDPQLPALYNQYIQFVSADALSSCFGGGAWSLLPSCHSPPCLHHLWQSGASKPTLMFLNRWEGYVPPAPLSPGPASTGSLTRVNTDQSPHYLARFALERSQDFQSPAALYSSNKLHVYEVLEFQMAPDDDLASRLFDFVMMYSEDWLYYLLLLKALTESPELLICRAPDDNQRDVVIAIVANESLPQVIRQLGQISVRDGVTIEGLRSDHINWW